MKFNRHFAVAVMTVAACASAPFAAAKPAGEPAAPAAAPPSFTMCKVCHATAKGAPNGLGPNLFGVAGAPAGAKAGYAYSPALLAAKLKWNDATLDRWLTNPRQVVPTTKMAFAGMSDPKKRAEVIAYLHTLK